jgi:hypothetical protein
MLKLNLEIAERMWRKLRYERLLAETTRSYMVAPKYLAIYVRVGVPKYLDFLVDRKISIGKVRI